MNRIKIWHILIIICLTACKTEENSNQIVKKAILYAGGKKFEKSEISFDFRDIHYVVKRNANNWMMSRSFEQDSNFITDVYTTSGFERKVNEQNISVADSMAFKYIESINSVIYFALLPYKLNDAAVQKESLGKEEIKGKVYFKIGVSFKKEGGGEDYQDLFIYWFDVQDYSLDYLAYSFEVNGGGMRFRKAYNERFVEGIRFVDYVNFKPISKQVKLEALAQLFAENELEELSKIELENIKVNV